ncbi:MAG TPA: hypothetical protein VIR57_19840 [Chloroflexota bacterium]|jgi:hypothetical protein
MMTTKERVHQLVDGLPEQQLRDAQSILEALHAHNDDLLARKLLTAPIDSEPETDVERDAVAEARIALASGDVVRDEDLDRELGW